MVSTIVVLDLASCSLLALTSQITNIAYCPEDKL